MSSTMRSYIGPSGSFLQHGLEFRPEQLEMAEAVDECIRARRPCLIEAGTGVGKSLAYLLPAALAAHREHIHVLVSTHTRTLQEQLVKKDLPFLSTGLAADGVSFSFALFMGSENYLCLRRFHQAIRDANALFVQPSHVESLERLLRFVEEHPCKSGHSGLRMDMPDVHDEVWRNVLRESDNCMATRSPYQTECYHRAAQAQLRAADILVVNHALFFANIASGGRVLPAYDIAILDEAHSVEEVAASHLGIHVTNFSIKWLFDQIYHPETERGLAFRFPALGPDWRRSVLRKLNEMKRRTDEFFENMLTVHKVKDRSDAIRVRKPHVVPNTLSEGLLEVSQLLQEAREKLESPEDRQEMKIFSDRLSSTSTTIESFLEHSVAGQVYWFEAEKRARGTRVQLRAAPVDISGVLRQTLFDASSPTTLMTSATLAVKDDFEYMQSRIGAERVSGICLGSPFNYRRNCLLYMPDGMPDPSTDGYYAAVESQTEQLIRLSGGAAFVLTTSHDWVHRLFRNLSEKMADYQFFRQGGAKPFGMLSEFKQSDKAVLLGTDTFWQGVDVPGEALRMVIVTRLPFAMPEHPLEEAKIEFLKKKGFDPFTRHTLPNAVLMLRQGFGRLIRRSTDRGVVAILDPRIRTRAYGQVFLKSLPPARPTSHLADVRRFFEPPKN